MSSSLLEDKVSAFFQDRSLNHFTEFFLTKTLKFKPVSEPFYDLQDFEDYFSKGEKLGEIFYEDEGKQFLIAGFKSTRELSERSSKKRQFEFAKKILKAESYEAGIFIFYDSSGNFRMSLVYEVPAGRRRGYNDYKRYTYFVEQGEPYHTFLKQVGECDFSSFDKIVEGFSVEKVTKEFFEAYKYAIDEIIVKSLSKYNISYEKKHSFAQLLMSRILFVYFLQRKRWLKWKDYKQDKNYIRNLWIKYKDWREKTNTKDVFCSKWLSSLFFGAFNSPTGEKRHIDRDLPEDIKESFILMPFLNGGLFSKTELDKIGFDLPDYVFEWIFEPSDKDNYKGFLEIFNFTIEESTSTDIEVAVDPEMLGKVYESLIAEKERGSGGIFYTPRVEIDFMCKLSLVHYLERTGIDKQKIIQFVFHPQTQINQIFTPDELGKIKSALDKVKIVDPTVGSASFLVGMLSILVELHTEIKKQLEGKEENLFSLKKKIIADNLYGVDVKDWAVMVGELRLWLNLIIETDEKYMDIYTQPLLPNFSFKIRQGDALIEEIADIPIKLYSLLSISKDLEEKIKDLASQKTEFFYGQRSADLKEKKDIERLEEEILKEIVELSIKELKRKKAQIRAELNKRKSLNQKSILGEEIQTKKQKQKVKELTKEVSKISEEIARYQQLISQIGSKTKKDYFLWEIDFAEVFYEKGGFDIVIGNPPYVRQELIAPPLENSESYSSDEWRKIKRQYKEKLIESVKSAWADIAIKIDKKSDLYVYFYYQGLSLLQPGGIFCFINSNSWLDVGYGIKLQEFLLKNMQPLYIIDNLKKRSFKHADVNTVIVLIKKPEKKINNFTLKFVAFKKPFEDVLNGEVIKDIEATDKPVFDDENFRLYPKTKKELLEEGVEVPKKDDRIVKNSFENLPYIGNKWGGKYLRAPEIYFKILEKGKDKLVRLGDIAEVRFGIKTGANEFFYLKPVEMTVKEVVEIAKKDPHALIKVQNGAGWEGEIEAEFLKPLLFSLKEVEKYQVELDLLEKLILFCPGKVNKGKILDYIRWGEIQGFNKRSSVTARKYWYVIPSQFYPHFVSNRFLGERFGFPVVENIFVCDVFFIGMFKNIDKNIGVALINSTISYLSVEVIARKTYGIGVAYIYGPEINNLLLLNPNLLPKNLFTNLKNIFVKIKKRSIYPIFTELGFDSEKPIREQEPNPLPDRKALDDIVFDALGLTEQERKEVYWAVAELVKNRLDKARSV